MVEAAAGVMSAAVEAITEGPENRFESGDAVELSVSRK